MSGRQRGFVWVRLRVIPIETLSVLVNRVAIALDNPSGEVQILPNLKRDVVSKVDSASQFRKGGAMPNNDQSRMANRGEALLKRVNEPLVSWQFR